MYEESYITILDNEYKIPYSFFMEHSYASENDIVIVGGTLIEGIGNSYSDIDVYVITDRFRRKSDIDICKHHRVLTHDRSIIRSDSEEHQIFLIQSILPGSHIKVDFEYRTYDEIENLFLRVDEIFEYATRNLILLTKQITDREECFIHRIFNCVPIYNTDGFSGLLKKVDIAKYSYLAYRWVASDFSVLMDIIGAWTKNELDRAVELARNNLIMQMMSCLHICGVTNTDPKWLLTYLYKNPYISIDIRERFMALYYFKDVDDELSKKNYVKLSLDLVDDIYRKSVPFLEKNELYPSGEQALSLLSKDLENYAEIDEFKSAEYAYRARAYGRDGMPTRSFFAELD
jgi:hypothetical protein